MPRAAAMQQRMQWQEQELTQMTSLQRRWQSLRRVP